MTEPTYFFGLILHFVIFLLKQTKKQSANTPHPSGKGKGVHLQEAIPKLHRESSSPQRAFLLAPSLLAISAMPLWLSPRALPLLWPPSPSHAQHAASPTRLWSQPRSSGSTDSLKHSNQIRPLSAVSILQQGEHRVKFKEVGVGLHKKG